jgi:hypothetical protein
MCKIKQNAFIPTELYDVMVFFEITENDINNMTFSEFKDFCSQLDSKQLKQIYNIITDDLWRTHISSLMDNAELTRNSIYA